MDGGTRPLAIYTVLSSSPVLSTLIPNLVYEIIGVYVQLFTVGVETVSTSKISL